MRKEISDRAEQAIAGGVFPGCVIGVVRADGDRSIVALGHFAYDQGRPTTIDTVYDVASVTKSIPVASLAAIALDRDLLSLSDLVRTHIPELKNDHAATIEDLLRYRVRGARMSELRYETFEEIRTHVFESGFTDLPGASAYTNLPAFLLGIVLERALGKSIPALADEHFFQPLRMARSTFFPHRDDCTPTEIDERGEVRGMPHDESAYVFAAERRAVGHAGLFSTVPDLLNFLEAILKGGKPFAAIRDAAQKGLGWQLNEKYFMGSRFGPRTFGKTGFTGASVVADADRGVALAILSNRTYPTRPADAYSIESGINTFRADIANIVLSGD
jgi:CubicO group peptidase (beta-lactamase class C family)